MTPQSMEERFDRKFHQTFGFVREDPKVLKAYIRKEIEAAEARSQKEIVAKIYKVFAKWRSDWEIKQLSSPLEALERRLLAIARTKY